MGEQEKLANVAVAFTIGDKVYKVKQLSILQIANIRQSMIDSIKAEYKKDISDMISTLPEKDRVKFLLDSLKAFVASDEDINSKLMSRDGIATVLSTVLKVNKEEAEALRQDSDNQLTLWDVYCHAMGVENSKDEDEESESKEDSDQKNA